jgi:ABC-type antimicrobial peptide transport system permease subunit
MGSAATNVAVGVVAGMLLSIGLSRLMATWVGNSAIQPLMVGAVVALLLLVAAAACLVPARRAVVIDPMIALRRE